MEWRDLFDALAPALSHTLAHTLAHTTEHVLVGTVEVTGTIVVRDSSGNRDNSSKRQ